MLVPLLKVSSEGQQDPSLQNYVEAPLCCSLDDLCLLCGQLKYFCFVSYMERKNIHDQFFHHHCLLHFVTYAKENHDILTLPLGMNDRCKEQ